MSYPSRNLSFQQQDASVTLEQALAEHRANTPGLLDETNSSPEWAELMASHDVVHVVFGCGTNIVEEAWADTWTLTGTTVPLREYLSYASAPENKAIVNDLGFRGMVAGLVGFVKYFPLIWRRARRMSKPWPWGPHREDWHRTVGDIRAEYNIRVL